MTNDMEQRPTPETDQVALDMKPSSALSSIIDALKLARRLERQRDALMEALSCPNCPNQGWYEVRNRNTGEPEQEQCEFCYTTPNSYFNVKASIKSGKKP